MNRLDELLERLCPDGVEYKTLGEIANIKRGERVTKKDLHPLGEYKVISGGEKPLGYLNKYNRNENTITIAQYGSAGFVDFQKDKFWANDVCYSIIPTNLVINKYLYYCLINQQSYLYEIRTNAIPAHLPADKLKSVTIPLPPLEVQNEIVNILDSFTQLEAELEAELEARRKQYEYYLDYLCDFSQCSDIPYMNIGNLYEFKNGLNKGKEYFGTGMPIINFTDVYNNRWLTKEMINGSVDVTDKEIHSFSAKKGDIFFTRTSETQEDIGHACALLDDVPSCVFSGFVLRARPKTKLLLPKFVAYYLSTHNSRKEIVRYSTYTTRALTSGPRLSKLLIAIPPLEEQARIVSLLDRFDTLCNDLTKGLPAEIEARKKQYEYYREKLLTFKKK